MTPRGIVAAGLAILLPPAAASEPKVPGPPYGHPTPGFPYPQYDNFTLWLVEEFDAPIDLNKDDIWTWSDGGLREGAVRFVKEAITFEAGTMIIEASQEPPVVPPQPCSHAEDGPVDPKRLFSGEMRTKHNMFRYGRYEVRMRAPSVQPDDVIINGNYISTMFAFRDGKFHHWREIDIEVTGDAVNSIGTNVLNAEYRSDYPPDRAAPAGFKAEGANVREDFFTVAFEWLPSGITWTFNGEPFRHYGAQPADKAACSAHPACAFLEGDCCPTPGGAMLSCCDQGEEATKAIPIPEMSTKIMMNLWVFGGPPYYFGGPDGQNNRYPMRSEYDWFRFYKWNGDAQYPCAGMGVDCLSAEDQYLSGNNPCDGIEQVGDQWRTPCEATCLYTNWTEYIVV